MRRLCQNRTRDHRTDGGGLFLWLAALLVASPTVAATRAGTVVSNTAALAFDGDAGSATTRSNTDRLLIAERLDVALAAGDGPAASAAIVVVLTNPGNGDEAFALAATSDAGKVGTIAIDSDQDGVGDTALVDGHVPPLPPGAALHLIVTVDRTDQPTAPATVEITARATTGTGEPGRVFDLAGDGGGDAVVGPTGATAVLRVTLTPPAAPPTLLKRQDILAPDGSPRPIRGAIVTYTLEATFPAAVAGARIDDAVPVGTVFVPGSIRLGDTSLSDAVDGDPGGFDGRTVSVRLGDVPAGDAVVRFQVRIP